VVTVLNLQVVEGSLDAQATPQGSGTGFIIDDEGHIVTNWHVVTGGEEFAVVLYDGTSLEAELIGSDPRDDLAVVKIDPGSVPDSVSFGRLRCPPAGAVGARHRFALGAFTNTVTLGIVRRAGPQRIRQRQHLPELQQPDPARCRHQPRQLGWPTLQPAR
jgi:S1-C subfamily serine protease